MSKVRVSGSGYSDRLIGEELKHSSLALISDGDKDEDDGRQR